MQNLLAYLARAMIKRESEQRPTTEPIIMELRERCAQFQQANPFKVGDLVTPKKGWCVKGHGEPHIVVEVLDPPVRHVGEAGSNSNLEILTIRVCHLADGMYPIHPVAHQSFEPYLSGTEAAGEG